MVRTVIAASILSAATFGSTGCYDPQTIIQRVRSHAIQTRLEELDLGVIPVTLPRDKELGDMLRMELHLFGMLPRHKLAEAEKQFAERRHLILHDMLVALRQATTEELVEANFSLLCNRLRSTVNHRLEGEPVQSVGCYAVQFSLH